MSAVAFIIELYMHLFFFLSQSPPAKRKSKRLLTTIDTTLTTMGNHAGKDSIGHTGMVCPTNTKYKLFSSLEFVHSTFGDILSIYSC